MNDTNVSNPQVRVSEAGWLLLIARLPPKPDYLRVKLRRRIQRIGAVALRGAVYVLPNEPESAEDFEWLRTELVADGGDAIIWAVAPVTGITDAELRERFRGASPGGGATSTPERASVRAEHGTASESHRGRTWVTREGVFVDRIASAWLIRRFIDPEATFRFVAARGEQPRRDELRFDMYQAEYTHEGDRCTFETLLVRFGLDDPALRLLAEIVHDIDCKDEKFERPEAAGVESILRGLVNAHPADADRVAQGSVIFDALYAQLAEMLP